MSVSNILPRKKQLTITVDAGLGATLPLSSVRIRRATGVFLEAIGIRQGTLGLVFLSDAKMRTLNRSSLGHDYVTDVVTFDFRAIQAKGRKTQCAGLGKKDSVKCLPGGMDAEIYICPGEARRNAGLFGETVEREILRYVAHGILHLAGYDDGTSGEREKMRQLEDVLLQRLDKRRARQAA